MGDRTAVMRDGAILQLDTPMMVYDRPRDVFVAQFIGSPPMNVLRGNMVEDGVEVEGHRLRLPVRDGFGRGEDVAVGIRAENIEVLRERAGESLEAEVSVIEPLGSHLLLTLAVGGQLLKASTRADFQVEARERVWLRLEPSALRLLGSGSQLAQL